MLRTTISTAGARTAARFPYTLRSNFRPFDIATSTLRSAPRRTFTSSKSSTSFTFSSNSRPILRNSTILQRLQNSVRNFRTSRRRYNGASATPSEEPTSLGGRLKKLGREYGWSALGVYFALSALDFPFCYLLVKYLGTERIGRWEEIVVSNVKRFIPESVKQTWHDWRSSMKSAEHAITGSEDVNDHIDKVERDVKEAEKADASVPASDAWGVEAATEKNKHDASLATQLALAYAIHKSFIFVRVPITAAITPKVVRVLRGWGWDIGKRTTKEAKALKRASMPVKKPRARWAGKPKSR